MGYTGITGKRRRIVYFVDASRRDIAEINAGIKTINDVLKERGKEPKPWGDVWYRPKNMIATEGSTATGDCKGSGKGGE